MSPNDLFILGNALVAAQRKVRKAEEEEVSAKSSAMQARGIAASKAKVLAEWLDSDKAADCAVQYGKALASERAAEARLAEITATLKAARDEEAEKRQNLVEACAVALAE